MVRYTYYIQIRAYGSSSLLSGLRLRSIVYFTPSRFGPILGNFTLLLPSLQFAERLLRQASYASLCSRFPPEFWQLMVAITSRVCWCAPPHVCGQSPLLHQHPAPLYRHLYDIEDCTLSSVPFESQTTTATLSVMVSAGIENTSIVIDIAAIASSVPVMIFTSIPQFNSTAKSDSVAISTRLI
ncbi:uncharacterized protein RAG0_13062 [Rhynchosporium agropyri]|uniref:Uncharacterized protein n=1 Tax=Rhynchosporium agropyri TaxID=914238 RepID=A0A1E1LB48_9HELO|nr:uncharacterized protein RAG0_13062 [Rhynchosporium agropyri]